jgi:hypothetical protein
LELGGAECYAAVEDQPVIFDDEPRNPSELARHPEREAILVSAGKEIDQLIEQEIGVEVTQAKVKQVTDKGIRILQCKMVYKRKYTIGDTANPVQRTSSKGSTPRTSKRLRVDAIKKRFSSPLAIARETGRACSNKLPRRNATATCTRAMDQDFRLLTPVRGLTRPPIPHPFHGLWQNWPETFLHEDIDFFSILLMCIHLKPLPVFCAS